MTVKGTPTKPAVDFLLAHINAAPGGSVSLDTVAKLIAQQGEASPSLSRLRTITNRYRRELQKNHRIGSVCQGGSIRFLTANEALHESQRGLTRIEGAVDRASTKLDDTVDPRRLDTDDDRKAHMNLTRAHAAVLTATRSAVKDAAVPKDVQAMPRLRVVNKDEP